MDIAQDYVLKAYAIYNGCEPYTRPLRSLLSELQARASPFVMPFLNTVAVKAQDSPGIVSVGVLVLFILIALQVLNLVRRIMMWWIRLLWWMTVSGLCVVVVAAVWQRGPERTLEDAIAWGSQLNEVWWREYRRWEGYQNQQKGQYSKQGGYVY